MNKFYILLLALGVFAPIYEHDLAQSQKFAPVSLEKNRVQDWLDECFKRVINQYNETDKCWCDQYSNEFTNFERWQKYLSGSSSCSLKEECFSVKMFDQYFVLCAFNRIDKFIKQYSIEMPELVEVMCSIRKGLPKIYKDKFVKLLSLLNALEENLPKEQKESWQDIFVFQIR